MNAIYNFVSGPLVWIAIVLFIGGSLYRLISMAVLAKKKDAVVYQYMDLKFALRSIYHWLLPFGSTNMKANPVMTIVAFAFHICLIITPLFLFAHVILFREYWGFSWGYIPDGVSDVMTLIVIAACIFFLVRRLTKPDVKYLTTASDYVLLIIVAAPFITGFWAFHQWPGVRFFTILHILAGEVMLVAIPFSRLSHMLFFIPTRAYMGSEFGGVRRARDW